jgi:hypothetical protein
MREGRRPIWDREDPFRAFLHLERERGRDRDLERVAKRCDRPPEVERGMTECGRRSVTSAGDRATAVTGIRRRTPVPLDRL